MPSVKAATPSVRRRLAEGLKQRFFLRFHITLILLFTSASGVLATRGLLWLGVETMWLRYLCAIVVAYGAFLLGVRLWLAYVGATAEPLPAPAPQRAKAADDGAGIELSALDIGGFGGPGGGGGASPVEPFRAGGGGDFGGGGASGSFADGGSGSGVSLGGGGGGGGGGWNLDLDGLLVLLLALLVLLLVVGGAVWLVWIGPEILTEAAFEAMLAGGLLKSLRGEPANWVGHVMRRTALPFVLVTAAALVFAWVGQSSYPQARTAREVVSAALSGDDSAATGAPGAAATPEAEELARAQAALAAVRGVDAAAPAARRADALRALEAHADALAKLGRFDEARADVARGVALVQAGDAPALREAAADLQRLHAWRLAESDKATEALAAYAALRAWAGPTREPALGWRLVWSLNQSAILQEQHVAEGSSSALLQEAVNYPVQTGDAELVREIAEASRLQGMVALWAAKRDGLVAGRAALATAIAAFDRAVARLPADAPGRGEAVAGLAYARYLAGDLNGAEQALRAVQAAQAASVRELITDYARHRTVPADAALPAFVEPRLAR